MAEENNKKNISVDSDGFLAGADVDGDGQVTTRDARLIAQRAIGLISEFPVEE